MKKLLYLEDKIKEFIETNKKRWYLTLFLTGLCLGFLFDYLTIGSIGSRKGLYFGLVLMLTEFTIGGSGVE